MESEGVHPRGRCLASGNIVIECVCGGVRTECHNRYVSNGSNETHCFCMLT